MPLQKHQLIALTAGKPLPPPLPRKRRNNEESVMQRALIKWWQVNCRHFGMPEILLASCPNGFNASAKRGSIMKAEGQRKGFPDLGLYVPRAKIGAYANDYYYHALFLELKASTGRLSPEQEVFHELLRTQGYRVEVCRTLAECIDTITTYLTK